jgi:hypothetical protein
VEQGPPTAGEQLSRFARTTSLQATDAAGFSVLPKYRIVERNFAWISRNRRLAPIERCAMTAVASVRLAMIRIVRSLDDLQSPATGAPHGQRHPTGRVSAIGKDTFDEWERPSRPTQ